MSLDWLSDLKKVRFGAEENKDQDVNEDEIGIEKPKKQKENKDKNPKLRKSKVAILLERYEPIQGLLTGIENQSAAIQHLKQRNRTAAKVSDRKAIMAQLEKAMKSAGGFSQSIKTIFDKIKKEDRTVEKDDSATHQIRINIYQTYIRQFHRIMQSYNGPVQDFKNEMNRRTRREIKIVVPDIDVDKMEEMVQSGRAGGIIKQALLSDNLLDVVRVIEERHLEILKIEQDVLEIHELFRDLAKLVDLQQESLDVIETRINSSKNYVERGEVDIQDAEHYQDKARSRRCCLLLVLLGIVTVILAPTLTLSAW